MTPLTEAQREQLRQRLDNNDVSGFYEDLESFGDPYGRLGKGVTDNDTWQGQVANGFAEQAAKDNGVDLSYGSPAWEELNKDLAERYLDEINNNNGNLPDWEDIKRIHNEEYAEAGLDENDWFPNKMLEESDAPESLWDDWMSNENGADVFEDVKEILEAGGDLLTPLFYVELFSENGLDPDKLKFAKNLLAALLNMDDAEFEELKELVTEGLFEGLDEVRDLAKTVLENAKKDVSDFVNGVVDLVLGALPKPSPLVLDLDKDGQIELVSLANSQTYWDIDVDGFAEVSG